MPFTMKTRISYKFTQYQNRQKFSTSDRTTQQTNTTPRDGIPRQQYSIHRLTSGHEPHKGLNNKSDCQL